MHARKTNTQKQTKKAGCLVPKKRNEKKAGDYWKKHSRQKAENAEKHRREKLDKRRKLTTAYQALKKPIAGKKLRMPTKLDYLSTQKLEREIRTHTQKQTTIKYQ